MFLKPLLLAFSKQHNIVVVADVFEPCFYNVFGFFNGLGIWIWESVDNTIYHNNFVNNTVQVWLDVFSLENVWYDGQFGNYWSDYEERYPDATERDDLGVWYTPYVIDPDNVDYCPLIEPWSAPKMMTKFLIWFLRLWNLHKGTENSLTAKLKVAIHMLDIGEEDGAIQKLHAFINRVEMLREKTLMTWQADFLISEAQTIIDLIKE